MGCFAQYKSHFYIDPKQQKCRLYCTTSECWCHFNLFNSHMIFFKFQNGSGMYTGAKPKKGVESLLGEHSNLVNLDNLVKVIKQTIRI